MTGWPPRCRSAPPAAPNRLSRLRLFRSCSDAANHRFPAARGPPVLDAGITASFHNEGDSTDEILSNPDPTGSSDKSIRRFTWWDHKGTAEWLQWTFPQPAEVSTISVYWFDYNAGCSVPASWKLSYLDGSTWKPVVNASGFGVGKDQANTVKFTSVKTTALRIDVQLADGKSGGVLQLKVKNGNGFANPG